MAAEGGQHVSPPAADAGLHLRRPAIGMVVFIVQHMSSREARGKQERWANMQIVPHQLKRMRCVSDSIARCGKTKITTSNVIAFMIESLVHTTGSIQPLCCRADRPALVLAD